MPTGVLFAAVVFFAYSSIFGFSLHARVDEIGIGHVVASFSVSFLAFVLGLSAGGWLWSRAARHVFNFSKVELEALLVTRGTPRFWSRLNQRAIDKLYAQRDDG